MKIVESCSNCFEASVDKSSTSYFEMEWCDDPVYGWSIEPYGSTRIETNAVNFHNDYTYEDLHTLEEHFVFPPCFKIHVRNIGHRRTNLDTNIFISLYDNDEQRTKLKTTKVRLFIPMSMPMKNTVSIEQNSYSHPNHCCNCSKPELKDLLKYADKIAYH